MPIIGAWAWRENNSISLVIEIFCALAQITIGCVCEMPGEIKISSMPCKTDGSLIFLVSSNSVKANVEFYVLELSSYQLDYTQNLNLLAGVVLNITPTT
jgi:UDP-N-acetylmuramoylalanine--D-glutamate ligase